MGNLDRDILRQFLFLLTPILDNYYERVRNDSPSKTNYTLKEKALELTSVFLPTQKLATGLCRALQLPHSLLLSPHVLLIQQPQHCRKLDVHIFNYTFLSLSLSLSL